MGTVVVIYGNSGGYIWEQWWLYMGTVVVMVSNFIKLFLLWLWVYDLMIPKLFIYLKDKLMLFTLYIEMV